MDTKLVERFNALGRGYGRTLCWNWRGEIVRDGYGALAYNGKHYYAHRLAYELYHGHIPEGMCVCHACDNRACVNPAHLFLGTQAENMRDAARKGRIRRGEMNGNAKLSQADVLEIRRLAGSLTHSEIADRFGVHFATVSRIVRNQMWKHAGEGEAESVCEVCGEQTNEDDVDEYGRCAGCVESARLSGGPVMCNEGCD